MDFYADYFAARSLDGLPPLPLTLCEVETLCTMLGESLDPGLAPCRRLLAERVAPGTHPAAQAKADFLAHVAEEHIHCLALSAGDAVLMLAQMNTGPGLMQLIRLLDELHLADTAARLLTRSVAAVAECQAVQAKLARGNRFARQVMEGWAAAEWFTCLPAPPDEIPLMVYRLPDVVPAIELIDDAVATEVDSGAVDIPLLAQGFGESNFPLAGETIRALRATGSEVALVTGAIGAGELAATAAAATAWYIGADIAGVPNQRRGGVLIATEFAPNFHAEFLAAGGIPITVAKVAPFAMGQQIHLHLSRACIRDVAGKMMTTFDRQPRHLADILRAQSATILAAGKTLTQEACTVLSKPMPTVFIEEA